MEIHDIKIKRLKVIPDERGFLMEILRKDDIEFFNDFGQVYISGVNSGAIKAWHYHKKQTDCVACIKGLIKLVIYDGRVDSPTYGMLEEFFIGELNPMLVKIPKGCYHGWKGIDKDVSLVVNCPDKLYSYSSPDEHRLKPNSIEIPYDWKRIDG